MRDVFIVEGEKVRLNCYAGNEKWCSCVRRPFWAEGLPSHLVCGQFTTLSSPKLVLASLIPKLRDNRLKSRRRQLTSRHLAAASLVLSDVSKATPSLYVRFQNKNHINDHRSHCSVHIQTLWWNSSSHIISLHTGWPGSPDCTMPSDNYNLLYVMAHEHLMYLQ